MTADPTIEQSSASEVATTLEKQTISPPDVPFRQLFLARMSMLGEDTPIAELLDFSENEIRQFTADQFNDYLEMLQTAGVQNLPDLSKKAQVLAELAQQHILSLKQSENDDALDRAFRVGTNFSLVTQELFDPSGPPVTKEMAARYFGLINSQDNFIRHLGAENLPWILQKVQFQALANHEMADFQRDLMNEVEITLMNELRQQPQDGFADNAAQALISTGAVSGEHLFLQLAARAQTGEDVFRITRLIRDCSGLSLPHIRELIKKHHAALGDKYDLIERSMGFNSYADLAKLYADLHDTFKEHQPNKDLLDKELQLVRRFIGTKADRVLEVGAGTGKLYAPLFKEGYNITGIDLSLHNLQLLKKDCPGAHVSVASWHQVPHPDRSFNKIISTGRSTAHNYTVEQWLSFFKEMGRVLDDTGELLMDLPNPDTGDYKREREKYQQQAAAMGFKLYGSELNAIVDSPDKQHFFDRMVPSREQLEAMAGIMGFDVEDIDHEEYAASAGNEHNENIYYRLKKKSTNEMAAKNMNIDNFIQQYQQIMHLPVLRVAKM